MDDYTRHARSTLELPPIKLKEIKTAARRQAGEATPVLLSRFQPGISRIRSLIELLLPSFLALDE
jgi:hypothetical protein